MKRDWKQFAEWICVEYEEPFECNEVKGTKYMITVNGVGWFADEHRFSHDNALIKHLIEGTLTVKWVPKRGEKYYHPDYVEDGLVSWGIFINDEVDKLIIQNVGIYKTPEEARAKALSLGWRELEEKL